MNEKELIKELKCDELCSLKKKKGKVINEELERKDCCCFCRR